MTRAEEWAGIFARNMAALGYTENKINALVDRARRTSETAEQFGSRLWDYLAEAEREAVTSQDGRRKQ